MQNGIDYDNLSPMEKTFLRMAPQPYEKEGLRILNETKDIGKAIEYVTRQKEAEKERERLKSYEKPKKKGYTR